MTCNIHFISRREHTAAHRQRQLASGKFSWNTNTVAD